MNYITEYINGYLKPRQYYPKTFNFDIAITNVLVFGLTSIFLYFFYKPLGYLFFLIIFTSTEADGNISHNDLCNKIVQKLDIIVILIIIYIIWKKTNNYSLLFLIPTIIIHHWKRKAPTELEYNIKMNIWHYSAAILTIYCIVLYCFTTPHKKLI